MIIKEFRTPLPMTCEEYRIGQRYGVGEVCKNETGGGDGVEVIKNEPFESAELGKGQYTMKLYYLNNKVPTFMKLVAPKGALIVREEAWNIFPYCKTVFTNPEYMKNNFKLEIISHHKPGLYTHDNVHNLTDKELKQREIVIIDIANDTVKPKDYKPDEDPCKVHSKCTGRGPLTKDWMDAQEPIMTSYKLVRAEFKWFGLQTTIEKLLQSVVLRIFTNFHRQMFCWMDKWHGMTMEDIRKYEIQAAIDLREARHTQPAKGISGSDMEKGKK